MTKIRHLLLVVLFAHEVDFCSVLINAINLLLILEVQVLKIARPMVDQSLLSVLHGGDNTAATIVATDDDVLYP